MHTQGRTLIGGVILLMGISVLACSLLGQAPAVATATAAPTASPPPLSSPVPATDTPQAPVPSPAAPTAVPATAVPPTPAPTSAPLLVVAATDKSVSLVTLDGQARPLAQAPATIYAMAYLSKDPTVLAQAFAIGPQGAQVLSFVNTESNGFAVYQGPAAPQGILAWDSYTNSVTSTVPSRIQVAGLDGSNTRVLLEQNTDHVLHVVRWSPDGKRLYYSKEPLGLGGYILFGGFSNLWVLDLASGSSTQIVPDAAAGTICLYDFTADAGLVAHACAQKVIDILSPSTAAITPIQPPPGLPDFQQHGDALFSPDETRVAFGMALGNGDNEQGWVAVSDGLTGTSRLVATAPQNDFYNVKAWLDNNTLILQSGRTPGVWLVQADGANLHRVADGTFLGVMRAPAK